MLRPARDVCGFCCRKTGRWIELGKTGKLRTLTVAGVHFGGFPEPPYAFGFVQLDGASTALLGFLHGPDWSGQQNWSELIRSRCAFVPKSRRVGGWLNFSFRIDSAG